MQLKEMKRKENGQGLKAAVQSRVLSPLGTDTPVMKNPGKLIDEYPKNGVAIITVW